MVKSWFLLNWVAWNVIESNRSNRLQSKSNSNRFENLKCNSNSNRWQCNSNRLPVIDPIPVHSSNVCVPVTLAHQGH